MCLTVSASYDYSNVWLLLPPLYVLFLSGPVLLTKLPLPTSHVQVNVCQAGGQRLDI